MNMSNKMSLIVMGALFFITGMIAQDLLYHITVAKLASVFNTLRFMAFGLSFGGSLMFMAGILLTPMHGVVGISEMKVR